MPRLAAVVLGSVGLGVMIGTALVRYGITVIGHV